MPKAIHDLKCHSDVFVQKWSGNKPWEYRKNDRNYQVGDILTEKEYNPLNTQYSGRVIQEEVTLIVHGGNYGIPEGYCIMTTKEIGRSGIHSPKKSVHKPIPLT